MAKVLKGTHHWSVRKPFTHAEAYHAGLTDRSIQELFEDTGEWNMTPTVVVDCTVLHRRLNGHDIHSGEHSTVIGRMVQDPFLTPLLQSVNTAFALLLRDHYSGNRFEVLCFDPYGQCRSVHFARIVAYCLSQCRVVVMNSTHHPKGSWQAACCGGDCQECKNSPMSEAKAAALTRAYTLWLAA